MSAGDPTTDSPATGRRQFHTTHWSLVLAAGHDASPAARQALAQLCETYWYPLYAYIRRLGHQPAEAQDLTQGFFVHLLEKEAIQVAEPSRGRFRSFLLASLNHYTTNQWRRDQAQKRGGGRTPLSLDLPDGERRYTLEPVVDAPAERVFMRRWAITVLDQAVQRLRDDYERSGKLELFDSLKGFLGGGPSNVPYSDIAAELGSTEGAVKVAVHRLRMRCREMLRREIAQTVDSESEVDEEIRDLFQAVAVERTRGSDPSQVDPPDVKRSDRQ